MTDTALEFGREHIYDYDRAVERYPETLPQAATAWTSVGALRAAVAASGSHWFDKATMRYFNSRVAPGMIGARFFITSERMDDESPRLYKVRWVAQRDNVEHPYAVYNFETVFDSLAKARTFAKKAHSILPYPAV